MRDVYYSLLEDIKNFFRRCHCSKAVIGLSGGVDSAVTLKLCCDALQSKNVTAIIMPEKGLTKDKNTEDALKLARKLKVRNYVVKINPIFESFTNIVRLWLELSKNPEKTMFWQFSNAVLSIPSREYTQEEISPLSKE